MKFCYIDESGAGSEPILVMAGVIVDATRMHITKADFSSFLEQLNKLCNRKITEFHTRDFYNGNGPWRNIDGALRAKIIDFLLNWMTKRKHHITFSAIEKAEFKKRLDESCLLCKDLGTPWRAGAFHLALQIQKFHQRHKKPKGHTVLIFDREVKEEEALSALIHKPPKWAAAFYKVDSKKEIFDQIIDVPYFADSKPVLLLQMADLIAYLLRIKAERDLGIRTGYKDEEQKITKWIEIISSMTIHKSNRYQLKTAGECANLFNEISTESLLNL